MKAKIGDVYTVYHNRLKCYTACQIIKAETEMILRLDLDWSGEKPLQADQMNGLTPLYKDFMYWERTICSTYVEAEVPDNYRYVGNIMPLSNDDSQTYGSWHYGDDIYYQLKWQQIPEERRLAFKEAIGSEEEVEIGGSTVRLGSYTVMDKYISFDSAFELNGLPCLSAIVCDSWHPDLLEFLRDNPFIYELTLMNHGQKVLDLRGSSIQKLMLDMTGLDELWLDDQMEQLLFQNDGMDTCTIHDQGDGNFLTIQFIGEYRPHKELSNLRGLHGIRLKNFDLQELPAVHPNLKELQLWGAPGNIKNFSAVANFHKLKDFSTFDLFGFEAADIPMPEQMPVLEWFWMTSLPEDAAKMAKKLWKGKKGVSLRITKPRKPEWLAQNLDNPFRSWDGAEHIPASAAKKAVSQYRKTRSELLKLANSPDENIQTHALEIVAAYTKTFNKMHFIETEERDEIYMALSGILDAMPNCAVREYELLEKFDELRDF